MITKTFKRYELKYLVTPAQFEAIRASLVDRMLLDEYCRKKGSYMIYNLYFDTPDDEIIRRSLEKPYYKEKLRLRSYTMPTCGEDTVFLELKKKIGGIVAKRRAIMTFAQATEYLETGAVPELAAYQDNQVMREISCFLRRYAVEPKVFISYERIAYMDGSDPDLRVSFDFNILTRRQDVSLTGGDWGTELLDTDDILMELKCSGSIPLWLCRELSGLGLKRTNFSKYGTEYKKHALRPDMGLKAAIG
jgi:hypothetical protein